MCALIVTSITLVIFVCLWLIFVIYKLHRIFGLKQRKIHLCVCVWVINRIQIVICTHSSVSRPRVSQRHSVQHLIQKLQSTVQMDLHPTWRVFDTLPWVVWPPALHKAETQDAQSPEVVHANPCCCWQTWNHVTFIRWPFLENWGFIYCYETWIQ